MATTNTNTRVAIYARVSTDKQDTENQAGQLREFAAKQCWTLHDLYMDHESGAHSDRPEFKRLFTDAAKRKFDIVLFWSLDRLSREGVLETLQHLNRLTSYGVAWRSFTEQYLDSTGMFKDAVVSILATIAKQERVRLSERTRAGLAVARAKGKTLGRPRVQLDTAKIRQLRGEGHSYAKIAATLNTSVGQVFRAAAAAGGE